MINFFKKKEIPKPAPKKIKVKKKFEVGRARALLVLKTGDSYNTMYQNGFISPQFVPRSFIEYAGGVSLPDPIKISHWQITRGKEVLMGWLAAHSTGDALFQITEDKMVRGTDIKEIANITESEYEIEQEVEVDAPNDT